MVEKKNIPLLLVTDSTYYPIFFRHYLSNYATFVFPSNFSYKDINLIQPKCIIIDGSSFKTTLLNLCINVKKTFPHIPLFILTKELKQTYFQELTKAGVDDFIQEPLEKQDVLNRIQKAYSLEKKLEEIADTALQKPHFFEESPHMAGDIRQKLILDKSLLKPFYKTLKTKKPMALLAIAVEHNEHHEFTEKQITDVLKRVIKPTDLLLPLGQGKYTLLLNHISKEDALFMAKTLHDVITRTLHIKIYMGITSQKKPPYANIHDMIFDAKKALLLAQEKGSFIEMY